jgi:AcrR family transcriptional regulator
MTAVARQAGVSEALVHHYFGSRAGLHVALAERWTQQVADRQAQADAALHPGAKARQRLEAVLDVHLDVIAASPQAWAWPVRDPGAGPVEALAVRARAREQELVHLRTVLSCTQPVAEYALRGYLGFVDAACLAWVDAGCPARDRSVLVGAAVNALEAALVRVGEPAALQRLRE